MSLLEITYQTSFMRDMKRVRKRGYRMNKLKQVIALLARGDRLPRHYRDHALKGHYADHRECHIEPDWLLIYRKTHRTICLVRTGTHADLFR